MSPKKKALKINIIQYHNIIVADERIFGGDITKCGFRSQHIVRIINCFILNHVFI